MTDFAPRFHFDPAFSPSQRPPRSRGNSLTHWLVSQPICLFAGIYPIVYDEQMLNQ
jgi:hypothetical protein